MRTRMPPQQKLVMSTLPSSTPFCIALPFQCDAYRGRSVDTSQAKPSALRATDIYSHPPDSWPWWAQKERLVTTSRRHDGFENPIRPRHIRLPIPHLERRYEFLLVEVLGQLGAVAQTLLPQLEILPFETDAGEAAVVRERDVALLVVPGVAFVVAEDRELGAVDGAEFLDCESQFKCRESVYFDEGPAAFEVVAQRHFARPFRFGFGPG